MRSVRELLAAEDSVECVHYDAEFITDERPVAGVLGELGWLERTWRCRQCGKTGVQRFRRARKDSR